MLMMFGVLLMLSYGDVEVFDWYSVFVLMLLFMVCVVVSYVI